MILHQHVFSAIYFLFLVTASYAGQVGPAIEVANPSKAGDTSYFNKRIYITTLSGNCGGLSSKCATVRFEKHHAAFGQNYSTPQNWNTTNLFSTKLRNMSKKTIFMNAVIDYKKADSSIGKLTVSIKLRPGIHSDGSTNGGERMIVHVNRKDPKAFMLDVLPPVYPSGFVNFYGSKNWTDLSKVLGWRFYLSPTNIDYQPTVVEIMDLVRHEHTPTMVGAVDRFGQYTGRSWDIKVNTESDLQVRLSQENSFLASNSPIGKMHGNGTGTGIGTGLFKVVAPTSTFPNFAIRHPNGNRMWLVGLNAVYEGVATPVEDSSSTSSSCIKQDRHLWFLDSPLNNSRYEDCRGEIGSTLTDKCPRTSFNYGCKNVIDKYGEIDYSRPDSLWANQVLKRLENAGINNLGMQSSKAIYDHAKMIPFTEVINTRGFPKRVSIPSDLWGTGLPDPYAEGSTVNDNFSLYMEQSFSATTSILQRIKSKPNLLGVFVDNEYSWGHCEDVPNTSSEETCTADPFNYYKVPLGVMDEQSTSAAKKAFAAFLNTKYVGSISALNTAWKVSAYRGSGYTGFDSTSSGTFLTDTKKPTSTSHFTVDMRKDFRAFLKLFAQKYYSKVRTALRSTKVGYFGLYLGSRFADRNPEVVSAAAESVDVLSFNIYRTADAIPLELMNSTSKPYLVSEFAFKQQARGTFGGGIEFARTNERAAAMKDFLNVLIAQPKCIGAQWYQAIDQPITARWSDDENNGNGVMDITDNFYPEMRSAFRDITRTLYQVRP